jgi:hypothetical protein
MSMFATLAAFPGGPLSPRERRFEIHGSGFRDSGAKAPKGWSAAPKGC